MEMQPRMTLADGYRPSESDYDSAIHEGLSRVLRECGKLALMRDFEVEIGAFLPSPSDRSAWLTPALHRLEWNRLHSDDGARWAPLFGPLISCLLQSGLDCDEEQLILLCRHADFLTQHHCGQVLTFIADSAWRLLQGGKFTPSAGQVLREFVIECPLTGHPSARWSIHWTLLRAGEEPVCDERPWAVAVACDLGALPDSLQRRWWALLDANPHGPALQAGTQARRLLAALPDGEFARRFDAWTRLLSQSLTPDLRCGGVTLLNWLLQLAAEQPGARLDESLYRIAQADWPCAHAPGAAAESSPAGWLEVFLTTVASRPGAGAFACAEALSLHPATAAYDGVQQLYQGLLEPASRRAHS